MRIGVVSDIHGNLLALRAVVDDMARRGVDQVVNLGDSLSGPLQPSETAEFLMAQRWRHLAGNHERQVLEGTSRRGFDSDAFTRARLGERALAWLATLSPVESLGDDVLLCHGTPRSDLEYLLETAVEAAFGVASETDIEERLGGTAATLVVCGHSHLPRAMRFRGKLLVNPGSVGLQAYTARTPAPHVVETASVDARYAIVERVADEWRASLVSVPYDHEAAAATAAANGAERWAHALRTGRALRTMDD
jgi:putative phosphoesterase